MKFNLKQKPVTAVQHMSVGVVGYGEGSANASQFSVGRAAVVGLAVSAIGTAANAAAIDVSGTVTDIGAQLVPIGLIGAAVLGVFLAVKAYHWVRKALA